MRHNWNTDAWNQEYIYTCINNSTRYKLISKGPDKKLNTKDDIEL